MAEIIIVDDDAALRGMVVDYLQTAGHRLREAGDARSLMDMLEAAPAQLVLLDISLPGEDGLSIARRLRAGHDFGIVMLTGADGLVDRVVGLELGADDYVTKPFELAELAARIDAVLRRRGLRPREGRLLPFGPFILDLDRWRLLDATGREMPLAPTEVDLVAAFATNPGRMLARDELLRLAPARGDDPLDRSIDNRVTRLRRKLERDPERPELIRTARGSGYVHRPGARP